jgi:hypothetical protein
VPRQECVRVRLEAGAEGNFRLRLDFHRQGGFVAAHSTQGAREEPRRTGVDGVTNASRAVFFYVGGVLLALLFVPYAYRPKAPVAQRANANLPVIRIHSARKWPERIVFDTSLPTIIPARIASDEASIPSPPAATDVPVKARGREALAQMRPSNAKEPQPSNPNKREPRLRHQAKIVKRHTAPQFFLAAR